MAEKFACLLVHGMECHADGFRLGTVHAIVDGLDHVSRTISQPGPVGYDSVFISDHPPLRALVSHRPVVLCALGGLACGMPFNQNFPASFRRLASCSIASCWLCSLASAFFQDAFSYTKSVVLAQLVNRMAFLP